jgi:hypothetical protein
MHNLILLFVEHDDLAGWIQFIVFTVILGGGAAFLAGRALATGWQSVGLLVFYMLLFTCGLRFLDYALFQSNMLSLKYFISHGLIVLAFALLGYRLKRVSQMTTQYPWLYEQSGFFGWRDKAKG